MKGKRYLFEGASTAGKEELTLTCHHLLEATRVTLIRFTNRIDPLIEGHAEHEIKQAIKLEEKVEDYDHIISEETLKQCFFSISPSVTSIAAPELCVYQFIDNELFLCPPSLDSSFFPPFLGKVDCM